MKKRTKKIETVSKEEAERIKLESSLEDCLNLHIPGNPTKFFSVGEEVRIYNWDYVRIEDDKCLNKDNIPFLYYKVFVRHDSKPYGNSHVVEYHTYVPWYDIFKKETPVVPTFKKEDSLRIQFMNQDISTLLFKVYHSGVDFEPDYQRGLVWELKDKISLIDSIFNNIDIGKFVFIERPFDGKKDSLATFINYEILDGKQRLTTLCEFFEGRFKYNGYKFEELNFKDRHYILSKIVQVAEVRDDVTQKQKYEYFLKLNTQGKPQDRNHMYNVQEWLRRMK